MKKALIIANGKFLPFEVIKKASNNRTVIALDGAANKLISSPIILDVIIGDFDSINKEAKDYWGIKKTFKELREELNKELREKLSKELNKEFNKELNKESTKELSKKLINKNLTLIIQNLKDFNFFYLQNFKHDL